MANSHIEWTERTWNPVTGCTKLSPGCKNCYAETMAKRLQAMGAAGYENGFALTLMEGRLKEPADRKKPAVYFVNSMSDTFHEDVPFAYIDRIFETIRQTPQHTYQILTKRAERMAEYFRTRSVPENVWLGVSVEDRRYGLPRIDVLRPIPATVRFISAEPLLEDLGPLNLTNIEWVIVGGESGSEARQMFPAWRITSNGNAGPPEPRSSSNNGAVGERTASNAANVPTAACSTAVSGRNFPCLYAGSQNDQTIHTRLEIQTNRRPVRRRRRRKLRHRTGHRPVCGLCRQP